MKSSDRTHSFSTVLAALLSCLVLLPLLGHRPLTSWDEGIYAEVSREMLHRNFFIPSWNYHPWFEKPPLMLWITVTFFRIFGVNEFWARAGSAFSGVALTTILHAFLEKTENRLAAWLSTLILLATFGFLHLCRVGEMDVLLSLGCAVAVFGLVAVARDHLSGWYLFALGFSIAAMTKGAAAIVLVFTLIILFLVERWPWRRLGAPFLMALAIACILILPWHLVMWHLYGRSFLDDYLGFHVLARATHQIEDHQSHWWYYFKVLLASAAPFCFLYPSAIVHALRRQTLRPWAIFALVVLVFFSAVQTRLPHYIAPVYPAMSLLTAVFLSEKIRAYRENRSSLPSARFWATAAAVAIVLCGASAALTAGPRSRLRPATVSADAAASDKESTILVRDLFHQSQPTQGPLLTWWPGDRRSVAAVLFYARRPVQQVELVPPQALRGDKYMYLPSPLREQVQAGPRMILLQKTLLSDIPPDLTFTPLLTGSRMTIGIIQLAQ